MFALSVLVLVLSAEPQELKIATPGLSLTGLDATLAQPFTDHIAQNFRGVRVITPRDISSILGLERQRQLLGCSDAAMECMAELGNALGVDGVLVGDVVKVGRRVQVNLRIIDPVGGKPLAAFSEALDSDEQVFDALARGGTQLSQRFLAAMRKAAPGEPSSPAASLDRQGSSGARRFSWIPLAVGGAALVGGAVCLGVMGANYGALTNPNAPPGSITDVEARVAQGNTMKTTGIILVSAGAALALTGGAMWVFGGNNGEPEVVATLTPTGAFVGGSF